MHNVTIRKLRASCSIAQVKVNTPLCVHHSHCLPLLIFHRRSLVEKGGRFQHNLWICLFLNKIISERLKVGWWNLVGRCSVSRSFLSTFECLYDTKMLHKLPECPAMLYSYAADDSLQCGASKQELARCSRSMCIVLQFSACHDWKRGRSAETAGFSWDIEWSASWFQRFVVVTCNIYRGVI